MHKKVIREFILESFLAEAGEEAGSMELVEITVNDAIEFCEERGFDVLEEIPEFKDHFRIAQRMADTGWTKRRDMPVIEIDDVRRFQQRLESGNLDVTRPFSPNTDPTNPFPEGLSGEDAEEFLDAGLRDGSESDDPVPTKMDDVKAKNLNPIQKQIYFDKSMGATIENGIEGTTNFLTQDSYFIMSEDGFIIDGHHRWLSAMLINPDIQLQALVIDLPIEKLLPLSRSYGDAIGNQRNL